MATLPSSPTFTWDKYPNVRRDPNVIDHLHGKDIPDPYRWLEDPKSDDTKAFIDAQVVVTDDYMKQFAYKSAFEEKVTKMFDYERYYAPVKEGDYYYFWYNSGLMNQNVLKRQATLDSDSQVFFDPNTLSKDGTVALSSTSFSEMSTYFAYSLSKAGSDWVTIHVKKVADKSDLPDFIQFAKFTGMNWTKDEKGFFYKRYPKLDDGEVDPGTETDANINAKVYYHKLGTPQSDDVLVWEDKDHPKYSGGIMESYCSMYLILAVSEGTANKNKLWIAPRPSDNDFSASNLKWVKIEDQIDHASFRYLTNDGHVFYFKTNLDAPLDRIVKYDLNNPNAGFVEVIPEDPNGAPLKYAQVVDYDKVIVAYSINVREILYLHNLFTGQRLKEFQLPTATSLFQLSSKRKYKEIFYSYSGFTAPGTTMRLDVDTFKTTLFKEVNIPGFDSNEFEAHQKFYESKDGTRIPMFVVHPKGINLDGSHPTFLYGYGGFSISIDPSFSVSYASFMKHFGAVIAFPNIRGGGEYGEDWHMDGALFKKQNVFDDFQWAAKYLISQGYTSRNKLAINGGSNGGLLVAACINQAPELFAAAVAQVGVHDMLRFHKFTIGHAWVSDFGDPDKKEDFEYLHTYSPLHNVKKQNYPATLLMTSDHDDRVVPLHSFKYIAELQYHNPTNCNPLLIHIERDAGHGAGKPLKKRIESTALLFSFVAMNTGAVWRD